MIRHYLGDIVISYFNHHDLPPDEVSEYKKYALVMKQNAINHGDLEWLKLAFEYLLSNPNIDCETFGDERYPYDAQEIRDIIQYAWETIWPNDAAPRTIEKMPEIELVTMSLEDWWSTRNSEPNQ
jgi:hypothetical protein